MRLWLWLHIRGVDAEPDADNDGLFRSVWLGRRDHSFPIRKIKDSYSYSMKKFAPNLLRSHKYAKLATA